MPTATLKGKGSESVFQTISPYLWMCNITLASKTIYHRICWLSRHKSHQFRHSMCFMIAGTDLWHAWPSLMYAHVAALFLCDFLAVIQLNLSSYPKLLKRQTPDATCSDAGQLMCLFA